LGTGFYPTGDVLQNAINPSTMPGYLVASFFGYDYEGVFMYPEELDAYPHLAADKIGDGRCRDVNDDKKLDQNDKTITGDNQQGFTAGFSNFEYKNFSLGIQLTRIVWG
jgi:hypothetical protein